MTQAKHVIILGIDGLRPDQITPQTMPHLSEMKRKGVTSLNHRTVFPSETRGALSALANGARPESTGVLGNEFYPRDGRPDLAETDSIHDWHYGETHFAGGMVRTVNLSETLARAGKSFAVVTSSGQGSYSALNWKGASLGQIGFNVRHPQLAYPHDLARKISRSHSVPSTGFERGNEKAAIEIFTQSIWPERRPAASIIWLTEVDSASHVHGLGAEGQLASMRDCDAAVGQLLDWHAAQPNRDEIAIFVTSDHGHSTITRFVDINEAFKAAGIRAGTRFDDGVDLLFRRGRAPGLWLRKPDRGLLQAAFDALHAQDYCGACFTRAVEPGSHLGEIEGTLALELTGAGHARAPDLYLNLDGDRDALNAYGIPGTSICDAGSYTIELDRGSHGGLHPAELSAVLVGYGAALKSGGVEIASRSGINDLAPTALHLLGVNPADTMTGRPLHELTAADQPIPALQIEEFTASLNGRQAHLRQARIGASRYVDEAWASRG